MADSPTYTDYHPRWLRRRPSTYWWLEKPSYLAFVLREGSCLFVGWFVVYLLLMFHGVLQGDAAYQEFLAWSARPSVLALNIISFLFLVYHAITFFDAAPRALAVHVGKTRVPERIVGVSHYAAWLVASLLVFWLVLGS
jgi:succinate dehydrogenase subunit C